jgi:hypothetical protein
MTRAGFRNASLYKGAGVEFVGGATIISSGRQPDLRSGVRTRPRVAFVARRSVRQLDLKIVPHCDQIGLE